MGQVNELKNFTRGQLDAALMKIGREVGMGTADGISAFLAGKLQVCRATRNWGEQNGVIYLTVTSNGMTGPGWEKWFDENKYSLSSRARFMLNSPCFRSTKDVTYEIAILKGMLFEENYRTTSNICFHAGGGTVTQGRKLATPNAEIACLIRKYFSNEDIKAMGLVWITTMHEPIKDSNGNLSFFLIACHGGDEWQLNACCDNPRLRWGCMDGLAFLLSQVSHQ